MQAALRDLESERQPKLRRFRYTGLKPERADRPFDNILPVGHRENE